MTKSGKTECQTCRATFSSDDKRILRGYYAYENEFQTKNCKAYVGSNNKDEAFAANYGQICCGTLEPVAVEQGEASTGMV